MESVEVDLAKITVFLIFFIYIVTKKFLHNCNTEDYFG